MELQNPGADSYVPAGGALAAALRKTKYLGIGAHQDDVELLAFPGIAAAYASGERSFAAVVCTDGTGCPRLGAYAGMSAAAMREARRGEQRRAAEIGKYACVLQLDYSSAEAKLSRRSDLIADLRAIAAEAQPEIVYTHNPCDKHPTHVAAAAAVVEALRGLPPEGRPRTVLGCEIWRDLDWLCDADKVVLDAGGCEELSAELIRVFDSQIAGEKRYDLAVAGRRRAHATFSDPRAGDRLPLVMFAMDLAPLVADAALTMAEYAARCIDRFKSEVLGGMDALEPRRQRPSCPADGTGS